MHRLVAALTATLCACVHPARPPAPPAEVGRASASQRPRFEPFTLRSARLSAFAGRDVAFEAMVLTPAGYDPACGWPVPYFVLERLGSDAAIVFVPGRAHADLFEPHPEL